MEKVFEDYFSELQADMVEICLEYVENRADNIYIYCSFEDNMISSHYFYCINEQIVDRHELNKALAPGENFRYNVSIDLQRQVLNIINQNLQSINDICKKYNREMPTEFKISYDVKQNSIDAVYNYEPKLTNNSTKLSDDLADEWFKEIKELMENN